MDAKPNIVKEAYKARMLINTVWLKKARKLISHLIVI